MKKYSDGPHIINGYSVEIINGLVSYVGCHWHLYKRCGPQEFFNMMPMTPGSFKYHTKRMKDDRYYSQYIFR